MKTFLILSLCLCTFGLLGQNDHIKHFELQAGIQHLRMLDRHASPAIYNATMPQLQFGFQNQSQKRLWAIQLHLSAGKFEVADSKLPELDFETNLRSYFFGLNFRYLRQLGSVGSTNSYLGGSIRYDLGIDFESVANFPWAIGQGRLGIDFHKDWQFNKGKQLVLDLSLPLVGVVTRLPYELIPRTGTNIPNVSSLYNEGTRVVSWNQYQRLDLSLAYKLPLNDKWDLSPSYSFSWFRYQYPKAISSYQQSLAIKLAKQF